MKPAAIQRALPALCTGLGLLLLWSALKWGLGWEDWRLPYPWDLAHLFWQERGLLLPAAGRTLLHAVPGFGAALIGGAVIGLALTYSRLLRQALWPYLLFLQMVPVVASAAYLVLLLDSGWHTIATVAFLLGFFPVTANTLSSALRVERSQAELLRLYGASAWQELWFLRLPSALPGIVTGAQIAATLAVIGAVTGELFAGSSAGGGGLGYAILLYFNRSHSGAALAAGLLASALGFAFYLSLSFLKHWLQRRYPFAP